MVHKSGMRLKLSSTPLNVTLFGIPIQTIATTNLIDADRIHGNHTRD